MPHTSPLHGANLSILGFWQSVRPGGKSQKPCPGSGLPIWNSVMNRLARTLLNKALIIGAKPGFFTKLGRPDDQDLTIHEITHREKLEMTKYRLEYIWLDGYTPVPN